MSRCHPSSSPPPPNKRHGWNCELLTWKKRRGATRADTSLPHMASSKQATSNSASDGTVAIVHRTSNCCAPGVYLEELRVLQEDLDDVRTRCRDLVEEHVVEVAYRLGIVEQDANLQHIQKIYTIWKSWERTMNVPLFFTSYHAPWDRSYLRTFIYKGTKTKWCSVCRADRAQSNGPTLRSH